MSRRKKSKKIPRSDEIEAWPLPPSQPKSDEVENEPAPSPQPKHDEAEEKAEPSPLVKNYLSGIDYPVSDKHDDIKAKKIKIGEDVSESEKQKIRERYIEPTPSKSTEPDPFSGLDILPAEGWTPVRPAKPGRRPRPKSFQSPEDGFTGFH